MIGGGIQLLIALIAAVILLALVVTVIGTLSWIALSASGQLPPPDRQWPRVTNLAIAAIPLVALVLAAIPLGALVLAAILARRGRGGAGDNLSSRSASEAPGSRRLLSRWRWRTS